MNLIKQIDTGPLHADPPIVVCVLLKAEFQRKRSTVFFFVFFQSFIICLKMR